MRVRRIAMWQRKEEEKEGRRIFGVSMNNQPLQAKLTLHAFLAGAAPLQCWEEG